MQPVIYELSQDKEALLKTCGHSFLVSCPVVKAANKGSRSRLKCKIGNGPNATFVSPTRSGFDIYRQPADPNPLTLMHHQGRMMMYRHGGFADALKQTRATINPVPSRLTTNLAKPVPPAFPTKMPELASKVRG